MLMESYLASLTNKKMEKIEITSLIQCLSGVIQLENKFDMKDSYSVFLMDKYK